MSQQQSITEIQTYLRQVLTLVPKNILSKFLLEQGKGMFMDSKSLSGPRATPKECYRNAYQLMMSNNMTYVEGYCATVIPIEHAWCVNRKGIVVDPTLVMSDYGPNGYFGVAFNRRFVMQTALKSQYYGIFSYTNPDLEALLTGEISNWRAK